MQMLKAQELQRAAPSGTHAQAPQGIQKKEASDPPKSQALAGSVASLFGTHLVQQHILEIPHFPNVLLPPNP